MANLRINKGASLDAVFTITDEDSAAVDLTGSISTLYVAKTLAAATMLLTKTLTNGGTVGTLTYSFEPSDTSSLESGVYEAQIRTVYSGSGAVYFSSLFSFIVDEVVKVA